MPGTCVRITAETDPKEYIVQACTMSANGSSGTFTLLHLVNGTFIATTAILYTNEYEVISRRQRVSNELEDEEGAPDEQGPSGDGTEGTDWQPATTGESKVGGKPASLAGARNATPAHHPPRLSDVVGAPRQMILRNRAGKHTSSRARDGDSRGRSITISGGSGGRHQHRNNHRGSSEGGPEDGDDVDFGDDDDDDDEEVEITCACGYGYGCRGSGKCTDVSDCTHAAPPFPSTLKGVATIGLEKHPELPVDEPPWTDPAKVGSLHTMSVLRRVILLPAAVAILLKVEVMKKRLQSKYLFRTVSLHDIMSAFHGLAMVLLEGAGVAAERSAVLAMVAFILPSKSQFAARVGRTCRLHEGGLKKSDNISVASKTVTQGLVELLVFLLK